MVLVDCLGEGRDGGGHDNGRDVREPNEEEKVSQEEVYK